MSAPSTDSHSEQVEKVVIIGSGPAGLTAAIYTARATLAPLCIEGEEAGGQLMTTTEVENFPGFAHGVQGPELMAILREQAVRFGTRMITQNVKRVDFSKRPFEIEYGKQIIRAKSVIISTGASAKYLGLESERRFLSKGVSACATCDGAFFRNMEVAIVGGGDTAMEEASFLTRFASKVIILHRSDSFRASKIMLERCQKNPKIEFRTNTVVEEVLGDQLMTGLRIRNTQTQEVSELNVSGLFVAIGHQPNTSLFKGQLELDSNGYIVTRAKSSWTSVEGVFAAGDVQDHVYRQAITAAGSGCMAAIDCERWLEKNGE